MTILVNKIKALKLLLILLTWYSQKFDVCCVFLSLCPSVYLSSSSLGSFFFLYLLLHLSLSLFNPFLSPSFTLTCSLSLSFLFSLLPSLSHLFSLSSWRPCWCFLLSFPHNFKIFHSYLHSINQVVHTLLNCSFINFCLPEECNQSWDQKNYMDSWTFNWPEDNPIRQGVQ